MTGTPVFQYKIPYEEWYFIVTSSGLHFYFNKSKKKSYWQLYDIFQDNPGIDQNEFINCINMEDVALLMSRVNGLKGLDGYFFKGPKIHSKDLKAKLTDVESTNDQGNDEEGTEEAIIDKEDTRDSDDEEEEAMEYDKDEKDEFIRNLLLEEGYIKEETELAMAVEKEEKAPDGLDLGYSSSEEDSEEEENQDIENGQDDDEEEEANNKDDNNKNRDDNENHNVEKDNASLIEANDKDEYREEEGNAGQNEENHIELTIHNTNESDDETQNNLGLDLSLSDDERDTTQDFLQLLDCYKDRISVYDPWFLVEEELLSEFITKPEYYSIHDSSERESIFNQWCKVQQDQPQNATAEVEVEKSKVYPTLTQMYFKYLQNHKKELKKYFYSQFSTKFADEIDLTFGELPSKERESLYRQYKIMITDYADYEKKIKKSGLNDINLKKLRLDNFLKKNCKTISNNAESEGILQVEDSTEDSFSKWAKLCNLYNIPTSIGNNVENFIVGDEKRLQSYIETLSKS